MPQDEATEAVRAIIGDGCEVRCFIPDQCVCWDDAKKLLSLPAAARWRLIGWLAEGLEPTRGMVERVRSNGGDMAVAYLLATWPDALAAAREATE